MSYNGYANEDSWSFDVVWSNDFALYEAFREYARNNPTQTEQTLGLNILHGVKAALNGGGWGHSGIPVWLTQIPWQTWRNLADSGVDLNNVNETEFGENVMETLGNE